MTHIAKNTTSVLTQRAVWKESLPTTSSSRVFVVGSDAVAAAPPNQLDTSSTRARTNGR